MSKLHTWFGITLLIFFIGTGQWMGTFVPELGADQAMERMAWRANHIYLLFSGLLNLVTGIYWQSMTTGLATKLQKAGSPMLIVASAVLVFAFFTDPVASGFDRFATLVGVVLSLVSVLLISGAKWWQGRTGRDLT